MELWPCRKEEDAQWKERRGDKSIMTQQTYLLNTGKLCPLGQSCWARPGHCQNWRQMHLVYCPTHSQVPLTRQHYNQIRKTKDRDLFRGCHTWLSATKGCVTFTVSYSCLDFPISRLSPCRGSLTPAKFSFGKGILSKERNKKSVGAAHLVLCWEIKCVALTHFVYSLASKPTNNKAH